MRNQDHRAGRGNLPGGRGRTTTAWAEDEESRPLERRGLKNEGDEGHTDARRRKQTAMQRSLGRHF